MQFEDFIKRVDAFALERDWAQFHSVRNLVLAMVGEVGELADVLMYALRLASVSGVDVMGALEAKLASNAEKYPVDKSKGSAKKYTDL